MRSYAELVQKPCNIYKGWHHRPLPAGRTVWSERKTMGALRVWCCLHVFGGKVMRKWTFIDYMYVYMNDIERLYRMSYFIGLVTCPRLVGGLNASPRAFK